MYQLTCNDIVYNGLKHFIKWNNALGSTLLNKVDLDLTTCGIMSYNEKYNWIEVPLMSDSTQVGTVKVKEHTFKLKYFQRGDVSNCSIETKPTNNEKLSIEIHTLWNQINEIINLYSDYGNDGFKGRAVTSFNTLDVIAHTIKVVDIHSFVPASDRNNIPTYSRVLNSLLPYNTVSPSPTIEQYDRAKLLMDKFGNISNPPPTILDSFSEQLEQKITRLCKHDDITFKDLPTIVCIVQWQLEEATLPTSIGKVGDKIKITVEVITNREVLGVFGKYNELYMRSDDGQEYDWYSNRYFDVVRGDKLELMGVIASVQQKYGRIRTRINYVKLLNR